MIKNSFPPPPPPPPKKKRKEKSQQEVFKLCGFNAYFCDNDYIFLRVFFPDPNKTSPGARMLKKARSFKDELKDRITHHIKRSPTHSGAHSGHTSHSPSPSPSKSPKTALKKNRAVHRAGSFNEGTRTEKKAALDVSC